jgi:hypothetical protein
MAAAGLRFSTMNITNDYVDMSLKMLAGASRNVNSTGYVGQVVNPITFDRVDTQSPEGQSFIILAYAAYNDWDKAGKPGNPGDKDPLGDKGNSGRASFTAAAGLAAIASTLAYVLA